MTAEPARPKTGFFKAECIIVIALYLYYAATLGRTLAWFSDEEHSRLLFPYVIGLDVLFILLYTIVLLRPGIPHLLLYLYFAFQSCLVLAILLRNHDLDFTTGFFLLLSHQVALYFRGRTRLAWILIFLLVAGGQALLFENPLRNLALQTTSMAGYIVLTAYIVALQDEEAARAQSQEMLTELHDTHRKLEVYASQVEDLAAINERNQLARTLHDSVSQTMFSIILNVRATQLLQQQNPALLRSQLQTLQQLTQSSLAEMRSLIAQLRPK